LRHGEINNRQETFGGRAPQRRFSGEMPGTYVFGIVELFSGRRGKCFDCAEE